jgi:hypothetical protein
LIAKLFVRMLFQLLDNHLTKFIVCSFWLETVMNGGLAIVFGAILP